MNIYLLENKKQALKADLKQSLSSLGIKHNSLALPSSPQGVSSVLPSAESALIFMPAIWTDLFIVKVLQTAEVHNPELLIVACGTPGEVSELVLAFNEGLYSLLEYPVGEDKLRCLLKKAEARLSDSSSSSGKLPTSNDHCLSHFYCPEHEVRDRMLASAFVDTFYREGPFVERKIRVLSVSPSSAQQQLLQNYLNKLDIAVDRAGSIEEAVSALNAEKYQGVIASNVLPDGDAPLLSKRMRGILKQDVPRLVVWTSNPENVFELRDPEHKIDDVVLKPSADSGMESLLISIIIGVYQTKV